MTNQELISLSEKVAKLYKTSPSKKILAWSKSGDGVKILPLYQDLERVMRLAIDQYVSIFYGKSYVETWCKNCPLLDEVYAKHSTKEQAVIVAVMKALIAKKEAE